MYASLGWGSVVGNVSVLAAVGTAKVVLTQLDTGQRYGIYPTAVHHENIAGMEVVLANGDVVRTGQYAMTTSPSAHLTKLTFGPTIDGLFLQSNLGIVTKMGIFLTPQPQSYMSCSFDMPEFEDVATVVDVFGEMRRNGTLPAMVYVFHVNEWAALFGKRSDWWKGEGADPGMANEGNAAGAGCRQLERQVRLVRPYGHHTGSICRGAAGCH